MKKQKAKSPRSTKELTTLDQVLKSKGKLEEFEAVASGYRLEIERMQAEVMEYLLHPPSIEPRPQPA